MNSNPSKRWTGGRGIGIRGSGGRGGGVDGVGSGRKGVESGDRGGLERGMGRGGWKVMYDIGRTSA